MRRQEAEPNAENATLEELRVAMEAAPNRRSYIRLAVMRSLLMGLARGVVAQQFCRSDRVVRLWIEMFNLGGIDALTTKEACRARTSGEAGTLARPSRASLENPRQAGELHWTGVKLHGYLKEQLGLEVGYSTTVRYLHELGYNLRVPRPWPERQNEEQRNAFVERFGHGKPTLVWSYGLPMNAGWRAIRARGGAGAFEAGGLKSLISETISAPTSLGRCVRPVANAAR